MSFPAYPAYKDSGVEWQGKVPIDWPRSAFKYLAYYQNGYPFKPEDWGEEGLPIIRISQLTGDTKPNYYSGEVDDRLKVNDGDLLFSWSATIDSFIWSGGAAWLNQHIFKVSLAEDSDKKFLFYLIKLAAPKLADFDAHGSTMRHIKKESLSERLHVPVLMEQIQIARFLDHETARIDALIEEQQRLIELLKEKRQAVISHAVTKGLDPTVPMKYSGVEWLGEVPEHWKVGALGYFAGIDTGATPDRGNPDYWGGDIPWIKTGEVNYENISESEEFITLEGVKNSAAKVAPKGTLLMAMYGQGITRGRVALLDIDSTYNQACAGIFVDKRVNVEFLRLFFIAAYPYVRDGGNETSQMNLSSGYIAKIKISVPPIEEQLAVQRFLDDEIPRFDLLTREAEALAKLLQERRSALISAAVTGKIDVRNWQPPAPAAA